MCGVMVRWEAADAEMYDAYLRVCMQVNAHTVKKQPCRHVQSEALRLATRDVEEGGHWRQRVDEFAPSTDENVPVTHLCGESVVDLTSYEHARKR